MRKIFLGLCFWSVVKLNAQDIVLEQDVNKDDKPKTFGQNYKNYYHMYIGLSYLVGSVEGSGVKTLPSTQFSYGFRYKRKINNLYAVGFDLSLVGDRYNIKQDSVNILPNNTVNDRAWLYMPSFQVSGYNRFNLNKHRGNSIGTFIDIGGFAQYNFGSKYVTVNEHSIANSAGAGKTRTIHSRLTYINPLSYGIQARFGHGRYVFYASYRLSDIFKTAYIFPELPRTYVGFQISMHK